MANGKWHLNNNRDAMKMAEKTKKDAESANDEFMQIRQRYKELRLEQRKIIIEQLEKAGFTVIGKMADGGFAIILPAGTFKFRMIFRTGFGSMSKKTGARP